jgi:peptide deformylase
MKLVDTTDERLYQSCTTVNNPTSLSIKMLRDRMIKIMKKENGIGLAAPQVGRNEAIFIMKKNNKIITCINPSISWQSDEQIDMKEGCLSFPKTFISLKRPSTIVVEYTDTKGRRNIEKMTGVEARCYQHELDHLSGITFIHRQNEQIS